MIGVLNMGLGNVGSLCQCLDRLGKTYKILTQPDFSGSSQLIFPGVGHFGKACEILDAGWRHPMEEWIESGQSLLGICLGFQLLFEGSEEAPGAEGLGVFKGLSKKVPSNKVPHMGWNQIKSRGEGSKSFDNKWMYFVHSYSAPVIDETIFTTRDGDEDFTAAVWKESVGGFQFHPEKSSDDGQAILKTFIEKVNEAC
jgi:imidazole glycerol phosphate synthase glutamine amidotransferase subunit